MDQESLGEIDAEVLIFGIPAHREVESVDGFLHFP
jgi:hypothetical protein